MKTVGIILIVIGIATMLLPTLTITRKAKPLKPEPAETAVTRYQEVPISPLLGIGAIATGAALVVAAAITKKR